MRLKLTTYYHAGEVPPLPGKNSFHSTALMRIYEETPGYRPFLVVASEEERPVGKLLAVVRKGGRSLIPNLIRRCEVFGTGEYFAGADSPREAIFEQMLERVTAEALPESFLIEFRDLSHPLFGYGAFSRNNYIPVSWLRVYNSLHSVERAEERFSTSRIRQVKRGLKSGATVSEAHSAEEVEAFTNMLQANYSLKIRRHFPNRLFFKRLVHRTAQGEMNAHANERPETAEMLSRIYVVRYHDKVIGGSVCIYSGTTAYLWFSGGLRKSYALQYPGVLAVWRAMADAKELGYAHFEFMDVGLPFQQHGYRDFVLRFGGKQVSTRRWFRFRWKWLNQLLLHCFE